MSVVIPPDASIGVQQALRQLDTNKQDKQDIADSGLDETAVRKIVQAEISKLTSSATFNDLSIADIMRASGPSHAFGYAPDPGIGVTGFSNTQAGTEAVLHEDAKWKPPLSGNPQKI